MAPGESWCDMGVMHIVGQLSDLPAILEALNPACSVEGASVSIRLDDPPTVSDDGTRCVWAAQEWGETERDWFAERGAGLVEVLDGVPGDWYPVEGSDGVTKT